MCQKQIAERLFNDGIVFVIVTGVGGFLVIPGGGLIIAGVHRQVAELQQRNTGHGMIELPLPHGERALQKLNGLARFAGSAVSHALLGIEPCFRPMIRLTLALCRLTQHFVG